MKKNIKILILTLCLTVLSAVFFSAYAAEIIESGECGENLTWTLDAEGTLTISGTGEMEEYNFFSLVPWYNNRENIKKVIVDEDVTSLSAYSFYYATSLVEVNLSNKITSIKKSTFHGCTQLKEIILPSSTREIGDSAFYKASLTSITFNEGLSTIETNAFASCTALTAINIPTTLKYINGSAFSGCTALTAVNISNLEDWLNISISEPSGNPLLYSGNLYLNENLVTDLIIPETVTSLSEYAFIGCESLITVTIPETITAIPTYAFYKCTSLTSVTIPSTVTKIGSYAFYECTSLKSVHIEDVGAWCEIEFVNSMANPLYYAKYLYLNDNIITDIVIPETVTHISDSAFYNGIFNSVTIPETLKSVGSRAFFCSKLKNVYISNLEAWCNIQFKDSAANPLNKGGNHSYVSDGGYLYLNGDLITELLIPETVTTIGTYVFSGIRVNSITIPETTVNIGKGAFNSCYTIEKIVIPDKVKTIGDYAFHNCAYLSSVTLPVGLESIGQMAFYANTGVNKHLTINYNGSEAQWNIIKIGDSNNRFTTATINYLGGMSGETMLDENFNEVKIPEEALIVAIFRKNATGNIIEEEAYGINFDGTDYPGAVEVPVDGIWVIKLVDPNQNILTVGQKYTYSVFTNGETIADNLTYTVK